LVSDREEFVTFSDEQVADVRSRLVAEAIEQVRSAVRGYRSAPTEAGWHALITALAQLLGDDDAYALLFAVDSRFRPQGQERS
jgi:hypothetical protein